MERDDSSASNKRKPGQPGTPHAVTQVQRLEFFCSDEPVHPPNLPSAKLVGLRIVFKDQYSLPIFSQDSFGQRLMRFIASLDRVAASLHK
jgi:hypothetical protein